MKPLLCLLGLGAVVLAQAAGPVRVRDGVFHDRSRGRFLPYRVYFPDPPADEYPVVIFSHGLGGSCKGAAYFGQHLAGNGYVVFHIQHPGSDESIWRDQGKKWREALPLLEQSLLDPGNALHRFQDIPVVIRQLEILNREADDLKGRLRLEKIGMAGHSYGGRSTMIAAGERVGRFYLSFKEPRLAAGLVLSPNLPQKGLDLERAYADVAIPLFHITGTRDGSPLSYEQDLDPAERTRPYAHLQHGPKYLLVLKDADHLVFAGVRPDDAGKGDNDRRHLEAVQDGALAFFNAYLKDDRQALEWLRKEFPATLTDGDRFTWKEGKKDLPDNK